MPHTTERTVTKLRELGAPDMLIAVAEGAQAPGLWKTEVRYPSTFYRLVGEHPGHMPFEEHLIPLWESNGDHVTAYVPITAPPCVIEYYYEDSPEQYEVVAMSVQEALERTLRWFFEELGYSRTRVLQAARECGHPSPEEFLATLEGGGDSA